MGRLRMVARDGASLVAGARRLASGWLWRGARCGQASPPHWAGVEWGRR